MFIQNWHSNLTSSIRASLYIILANNIEYKQYVDIVNLQKNRMTLTILRAYSHRLCVGVGRWHKPNPIPYENQTCSICNIIENEYNFVMEYTPYT